MRINVVIRHDSLGFSFGSLDVGLVAAEEHVVSQGLDYELNVWILVKTEYSDQELYVLVRCQNWYRCDINVDMLNKTTS